MGQPRSDAHVGTLRGFCMDNPKTAHAVKYTDRPRPKVFLPIPAYDWKTEVFFQASVMRAMNTCHAQLSLQWGMQDGIARTRNNLAYQFLKETDCEYLLFVDSDIVFDPVHLDRVVSHGLPICGGLYPKKQGTLSWVVSSLPGEAVAPDSQLLKVRETGTGFLCIRRDVLEAMVEKYPEIEYRNDPAPGCVRWDFFPMHASGGRYLSEDWFFCQRARECGFDVMVDTSVQVEHVGKIRFPLQKTLTDAEVVDLVGYRTPHSTDEIRTFLGADMVADLREVEATLWPEEYVKTGIAPNHCADVLAGCYDIPGYDAKTILDLGANIGAFTRWACARWPSATVTAFEPHPGNFDMLRRTVSRLNLSDRVAAHNQAVVSQDMARHIDGLLLGKNNCGEHSIFDLGEQTTERVAVELLCAHELPAADFLKIDTEGCEYPILWSLAAIGRLRDYGAIALEYHSEADREGIRRILTPTHNLVGVVSARVDRGVMKFLRK